MDEKLFFFDQLGKPELHVPVHATGPGPFQIIRTTTVVFHFQEIT